MGHENGETRIERQAQVQKKVANARHRSCLVDGNAAMREHRIKWAAFGLVSIGSLTTAVGLAVPQLSGERNEWFERRLREVDALGGDPGPTAGVGGALVEGTCCLCPMGLLPLGWLVLARDVSTASRPRWTPLDSWAGGCCYAVLALWCLFLGAFSWGAMELGWAAVGEFTASAGYVLAVVAGD
jgi:hypothetical protein